MNEEELRKIAQQEISKQIMCNLDSVLIFKYIQKLEEENNDLKRQLENKQWNI